MIKIITSEPNIRYLTGFTGSVGILMIDGKKSILIVDGRYGNQAKSEVKKGIKVVQAPLTASLLDEALKYIVPRKPQEIGYEDDKMTVETFNKMEAKLPETRYISISGDLRKKRMVKQHHEIDLLAKAALIADLTFDCVKRIIRPGMTEKDISAQIDYLFKTFKGEDHAFETLVSSGKLSAYPHGKPTDKVLEKGDIIVLDFGTRYKGYNSDMTRMVSLGTPSKKVQDIYDAVLKAQEAAIAKIKHGVTGKEVDSAARNVLKKAKIDKYFTHATGHGIGLQVHEGPRLSSASKDILLEGMVTTVEPGVYIPGVGGFRIEDMVLVTKKGCELLTKTPKELVIL